MLVAGRITSTLRKSARTVSQGRASRKGVNWCAACAEAQRRAAARLPAASQPQLRAVPLPKLTPLRRPRLS
jgi:hypothetical protein